MPQWRNTQTSFCGNPPGQGKTERVERDFAPAEQHPNRFSSKFYLNGKNSNMWKPFLSQRSTSARHVSRNSFSGTLRFAVQSRFAQQEPAESQNAAPPFTSFCYSKRTSSAIGMRDFSPLTPSSSVARTCRQFNQRGRVLAVDSAASGLRRFYSAEVLR